MRTGALALLVLSGCVLCRPADPPPGTDPAAYEAKRFALVGYCGPEEVDTGEAGAFAALQGGKGLGRKVVERAWPQARATLERALGGTLLAEAKVAQSPSYARLPEADGAWACAPGLRAVQALGNEEALGGLARELGVDAVVVVENDWRVRLTDNQSQQGAARVRVVMVGADGRRLWHQVEAGAAPFGGGLGQVAAEAVGGVAEEAVVEAVARAGLAGLDRFVEAWFKGIQAHAG